MTSNGSIFFAGVGTTFLILGAGFGSGLFMANSALKEPTGVHSPAKEEAPAPIRVILPSSAQAAEPNLVPQQAEQPVPPSPQAGAPLKEAQVAPDRAEKSNSKKADEDKRRKRAAERKARRVAERRNHRPQEAPVMAFGGNESFSASPSFNVFNN
jgi:type IV secretory pathway VirB10-like protein